MWYRRCRNDKVYAVYIKRRSKKAWRIAAICTRVAGRAQGWMAVYRVCLWIRLIRRERSGLSWKDTRLAIGLRVLPGKSYLHLQSLVQSNRSTMFVTHCVIVASSVFFVFASKESLGGKLFSTKIVLTCVGFWLRCYILVSECVHCQKNIRMEGG